MSFLSAFLLFINCKASDPEQDRQKILKEQLAKHKNHFVHKYEYKYVGRKVNPATHFLAVSDKRFSQSLFKRQYKDCFFKFK